MMKRICLHRACRCLAAILLFALALPTWAQTSYHIPDAEYTGRGENISSLISGTSGTKEKVYLYNVGTDRFLNAGGYWGTQTASFTVGLPITLTKTTSSGIFSSSTYYTMGVSFSATTGNLVGYASASGNTPAGFFLNRSSGSNTQWTFERVTTDDANDYLYKVSCTVSRTTYYLYDGGTDIPSGLTTAQDNVIYPSTTAPTASTPKGLWKLVTQETLAEDFEKTYDHVQSPSDASFLIRGQNFNHDNLFATPTEGTEAVADKGWYKPSTVTYSHSANTSEIGASTTNNNDEIYGAFECAAITGGNKGDEFKQRVTVPKQGWYRLDCQAFYHDKNFTYGGDNSAIEPLAEVFARVATESSGTPAQMTSTNSYNIIAAMEDVAKKEENKINTMKAAGQAFYYEYYPHHVMLYVKEANTDIELGVRLRKDIESGSYVLFDDFELKFLGTEVVMSELDSTINPKEQNMDYKNRIVMFERKMTTDKWNTLTLPFNVTKEALQAAFAFGTDVEVAEFDGFSDNLTLHFKTIDLASMAQRDTVLTKDKCYLVRTSRPANEETYTSLTDGTTTTINYYYLIERASFNKQTLAQEIADHKTAGRTDGAHAGSDAFTTTYEKNNDCRVTFQGVYENGHQAPANTYVMSGGDMYFLQSAKNIKGFRGWLEDAHQAGANATAARHTFGVSIDGIGDEATQIIGLFGNGATDYDGQRTNTPLTIHDLSGRLVRTGTASLDGLPRGIYIVNGKKMVK